MDKEKVAEFFDDLAPKWDESCKHENKKIRYILDCAGIAQNCTVLDVACGTGILFPFYLERNVKKIVGVDLSSGMIAQARAKFTDPRIKLIKGDVEQARLEKYDRCVVYNALPHFENPGRLIRLLSADISQDGRLTVAHCESKEKINRRHMHGACEVSNSLMPATELAALFEDFFKVDIIVDNDEMYIVSGILKKQINKLK